MRTRDDSMMDESVFMVGSHGARRRNILRALYSTANSRTSVSRSPEWGTRRSSPSHPFHTCKMELSRSQIPLTLASTQKVVRVYVPFALLLFLSWVEEPCPEVSSTGLVVQKEAGVRQTVLPQNKQKVGSNSQFFEDPRYLKQYPKQKRTPHPLSPGWRLAALRYSAAPHRFEQSLAD